LGWFKDNTDNFNPRRTEARLDCRYFRIEPNEFKPLDSCYKYPWDKGIKGQEDAWASSSANSKDRAASVKASGTVSSGFWNKPYSLGWGM